MIFGLGRGDGVEPNQCALFKGSCTQADGLDWDLYTPSPDTVPPRTDIDVCTHQPAHNADKSKRILCKAATLIDNCPSQDCTWNLIVVQENCGCEGVSSNLNHVYNSETREDCAVACRDDPLCSIFVWKDSAICELRKYCNRIDTAD